MSDILAKAVQRQVLGYYTLSFRNSKIVFDHKTSKALKNVFNGVCCFHKFTY